MTTPTDTSSQQHESDSPSTAKLKQAVVVIHGMGEQNPMETIREFVNQVWKQDQQLQDPHFWNKPGTVSDSFEQRRLTTDSPAIKSTPERVSRTDFFEYYWAHHTVGTKWEHFAGWFQTLLICRPKRYNDHPGSLKPLWYILWALLLLGAMSVIGWWLVVRCLTDYSTKYPISVTVLGIVVSTVEFVVLFYFNKLRKFFTDYFGDVARYVKADPANIAIRQAIRQGGVELLERIHQTGEYSRVVLVGHSLGSIIAYDILNHLWARHNKFESTQNGKSTATPLSDEAIKLIEQLQEMVATSIAGKLQQQQYWALQRQLFDRLTRDDPAHNWLISDFVTLGSPLTYADILLFDTKKQFIKRKLDREYPTSPPLTDNGKWYYGTKGHCYLHHGAVFAAVKWTNIYTPHKSFIKGDIISGEVNQNFSYKSFNNERGEMLPPDELTQSPIEEISLDWKQIKDGFTHTDYWQASSRSDLHLTILRRAIGLYPSALNDSQEDSHE